MRVVRFFRVALPVAGFIVAVNGALPAQQPPSRTPDIFFAPTRHAIADAMLKLARVTRDDVVYDLGSGDGRILVLAAQKYGARGVGIEIDHRLVELSREIAREGGVADRVTFVEGDLFTADISAATVVTVYLSASVNARLEPKLKAELRPGARVVAHRYPIGRWVPEERLQVDEAELFLWTIPGVRYQVSGVRYQGSGRYQVSGIRNQEIGRSGEPMRQRKSAQPASQRNTLPLVPGP